MVSLSAMVRSFGIAWCICLSLAVPALAQPGNVCVVDVAQIFREHKTFNQQLSVLQQEAQRSQFELQKMGQQLQAKSEQLKDFRPSSPQYAQLETELARESANLEVERRSMQRDLIQREAKLHFDTYVRVSQIIAQYCEQHAFRLALRYDSTEMKPDDPNSIMQRVNSQVVFHSPARDITPTIIQMLNQATAAPATPPANNGSPGGSNQ